MTNIDANREILEKIRKVIETYPEMRFGQIIVNMDIIQHGGSDPFFDDSEKILERINKQQWVTAAVKRG